jgi:histone H3/H4
MPIEKIDEESELPRATVDKLILELTPEDYTISKETRNLMREVAHTFIHLMAIESNKLCDVEKKKIIGLSHVYKSFEKYKFGGFVAECEIAAKNYEDYSKHKPSKQNKLNKSGKSLEELQALQMSLFKEAAQQQLKNYEIEEDEEDNENNENYEECDE